MPVSFDLVHEPWLPVVLADGKRTEVSLRRALVEAHLIRELSDQSPLVTAALHRLLLALLHRVVGPPGLREWYRIWEAGRFPQEPLDAYLERWHNRFDLFDDQWPFYQVTSLSDELAKPVAILAPERASGHNATLFDHTLDDRLAPVAAGLAARQVVAFQAYALGGLLTRETAQDRSADGAPLIKVALTLVRGRNLFETLTLNLHRYDPEQEVPFPARKDLPTWERDKEPTREARQPAGYLDLLTWQSRRIKLLPDPQQNARLTVTYVVVTRGESFPPGFQLHGKETMAAYLKIDKPAAGQEPWSAIGFSEHRAIWRDSTTLLAAAGEHHHRARTLDWLADLRADGALTAGSTPSLALLGMVSNQAKVLLWREERLPLPLAYLTDRDLMTKLSEGIASAEKVAQVVRSAMLELAAELVPNAGDPGARPSHEAREAREAVATRLGASTWYWAALESPFREFMVALEVDRFEDPGTGLVYGVRELPAWRNTLWRTAEHAFLQAIRGLDTTARNLKAVAQAEGKLRRLLYAALRDQTKEPATDAH